MVRSTEGLGLAPECGIGYNVVGVVDRPEVTCVATTRCERLAVQLGQRSVTMCGSRLGCAASFFMAA